MHDWEILEIYKVVQNTMHVFILALLHLICVTLDKLVNILEQVSSSKKIRIIIHTLEGL